jgi:hypothetical protein
MSTTDPFVQEFERLLEKIPANITFRQLQFSYRQVAFLMGMKILDKFPEVLTGPPPSLHGNAPRAERSGGPAPGPMPSPGPAPDGGPTIGPYPHELCKLVCALLGS